MENRKFIFLFIFFAMIFSMTLAANPWNGKVILQGYWWDYWNNNYQNNWATYLAKLAPRLSAAGIDAVWIPVTVKNDGGTNSTGFVPFDHYDLGDKYQKGTTTTRFGTKDEFLRLVGILHANGIDVIQDVVFNHTFGSELIDPAAPENQWKNFRYVSYDTPVDTAYCNRNGRFPKNWQNFHPNTPHDWPGGVCDDWTCDFWGPDMCYYQDAYGQSSNCSGFDPVQSPNYILDEMRKWSIWFRKQTGIDGYRVDAAKHFPGWALGDIMNNLAYNAGFASGGSEMIAFGEYIGGISDTDNWVDSVNTAAGNDVMGSFDFSLRGALYGIISSSGSYNMANIPGSQQNRRSRTIPFVNNHDTFRPQLNGSGNYIGWNTGDELAPHIEPFDGRVQAAYALAMAVDGSPCLWFEDLFNIGSTSKRWIHEPTSTTDLPNFDWAINLTWCHQKLNFKDGAYRVKTAEGGVQFWDSGFVTDPNGSEDIIVIERSAKAIIGVNDQWTEWKGATITTEFAPGTVLKDYSGANAGTITVPADQRVTIWVPPCDGSNARRGYTVWGPDGISGGFSPTPRSTTQEWEMANDLGDKHPQSLQQGGALPDSSTDLRTVGRVWSASGSTVTVEVFPEVDTTFYTIELHSHTGNFLAWKTDSGSTSMTYTPQSENWLEIKIRNTDSTSTGQKVYVKVTYTGPQTLNLADAALSQSIKVNAKVFLQGAFDTGTGMMNTTLNDLALLPTAQPFGTAPWNYSGTDSVSSMPADIVDWVLLELRTANNADALFARRAALLHKDGSIVDVDGSSTVNFDQPIGSYYLVIRHRNHLAITSSAAVFTDNSGTLYDFTTAQTLAYGTTPMQELAANKFGMRAGDGNNDGGVDALDKNISWRPENGQAWGYSKYADFNLDGGIDALDINLYWRLMNGSASQVPE